MIKVSSKGYSSSRNQIARTTTIILLFPVIMILGTAGFAMILSLSQQQNAYAQEVCEWYDPTCVGDYVGDDEAASTSGGETLPEDTGDGTPPAEDAPGMMSCPDGSVGTSCPEENVVPPSTVCDPNSQALRKGDNGEVVITLQNLLTERGYNPGTIDGDFGPGTEGAVIQFQTDNGLTADGIVGAGTWQELCSPSEPPSEETPGMMTCPDGSTATTCPEDTAPAVDCTIASDPSCPPETPPSPPVDEETPSTTPDAGTATSDEDVTFDECTPEQETIVTSSHQRARAIFDNAITKLENYDQATASESLKSALIKNMGSDGSTIANLAYINFVNVRDNSAGPQYECEAEQDRNALGWAIWCVPFTDVVLYPLWFAESDIDVRAETMIHEWFHRYGCKLDLGYSLNTPSSVRALLNADSFSALAFDLR